MYNLPPSLGLVPDLSMESAALSSGLSLVVAIGFAVVAIVLLVAIPLAGRAEPAATRWDGHLEPRMTVLASLTARLRATIPSFS